MRKEQLVNFVKEFKMWSHYSPIDSELKTRKIEELPFICWPDDVPFIEANSYMLGLLSTKKKATLRTYAYNISHLIRYCFNSQINLTDLKNSIFELFIRSLQAEKNKKNERVRNNSQVIKIGRACLDFLKYIARFHSLEHFIGEEDFNAIKIEQKQFDLKVEGRKKPITRYYLHHDSFPNPNEQKKRHPVADSAVKAIKEYVNSQTDQKIVSRDFCFIQMIELTGARRSEVVELKVDHVKDEFENSIHSTTAMLRLSTKKRQDDTTERFMPVPRVLIENLMNYIRRVRRKIIRDTIGKANDHRFVFIAHTTGEQFSDDSLGTYISNWRKAAGIEEEVHWHLFRHAFVTNKFIDLINEHDIENKDEFRKALFNNEIFKMMIQQWTGHTSLYSLDTYLDLAFASVSGSDQTYDSVMFKSSVDAYVDTLNMLDVRKNKNMISEIEYNKEVIRLTSEFKENMSKSN